MIEPEHFVRALKGAEIEFVCGVPDSLLKELLLVLQLTSQNENGRSQFTHHIVHNEGAAIAMAAGHQMGSGKVPLVYMQNSGLGNAVNPLMSLTHPRVYGIPMVLLIGHRGEPGKHDEPQHLAMGEATAAMLTQMGITIFSLNADANPEMILGEATVMARSQSRPVAILVSSGTFLASGASLVSQSDYSLTREAALVALLKHDREAAICATTGFTSRELYELRKGQSSTSSSSDSSGSSNSADLSTIADFLNVGAMGHVSQIALGAALACPAKKVVAVDGDGSLLMHLGSLATIGQSKAENLVHFVINNGMHESVGGQPTKAHNIDFKAMAAACGFKNCAAVSTAEELDKVLAEFLASPGPAFLEVKVAPGVKEKLGRPSDDFAAARDLFSKKLQS
jgi:phosphonopyruvate decarboxylase